MVGADRANCVPALAVVDVEAGEEQLDFLPAPAPGPPPLPAAVAAAVVVVVAAAAVVIVL